MKAKATGTGRNKEMASSVGDRVEVGHACAKRALARLRPHRTRGSGDRYRRSCVVGAEHLIAAGAIRATTFWHRQARLAMSEEWCGHPATCFERRSRGAIDFQPSILL